MQIRCNFPDISYLSETQKNNFQFLNKPMVDSNFAFLILFQQFTTGGQAGYAHTKMITSSIITLNLL